MHQPMPVITLTIDAILNAVEEIFKIETGTLTVKSKRKSDQRIAEARFVAMICIRRIVGLTHRETGEIFQCDHSLVVHAQRRVNDLVATDPFFDRAMKSITSQFADMPTNHNS